MGVDETFFVHVASKANTTGHITWLDEKQFRNKPGAVLMVTPRTNHFGASMEISCYDHFISLVYSVTRRMWGIANSDLFPMMVGSAFSVHFSHYTGVAARTFYRHLATAQNTLKNCTVLDHPSANSNPDAMILVTGSTAKLYPKSQLHSLGESILDGRGNWSSLTPEMLFSLTRDAANHPLGVVYLPHARRWAIVNNDSCPMATNMEFHLVVLSSANYPPFYEHTAVEIATVSGQRWFDLQFFRTDQIELRHFITNNLSFNFMSRSVFGRPPYKYTPKAVLSPVSTWWNPTSNQIAIVSSDCNPLMAGMGFNVRHS